MYKDNRVVCVIKANSIIIIITSHFQMFNFGHNFILTKQHEKATTNPHEDYMA